MLKLATAADPYGASALRIEEAGWTLGEVVRPGMLIASGPDACPYLIERIDRDLTNDGAPSWRLTGWYAPQRRAVRNEGERWWLNGWVAERYAPAPRGVVLRPLGIYSYDCPARDSLFTIVADQAFATNKVGQLSLF